MLLQSIKEYPWFYAVALLLLGVCVFAWAKAAKASRLRQARRDAIIAELEREKALRREFKTPTRQQLADAPPEHLVEGLCCYVQMLLEQAHDPDAAFAALPEPQRLIYALGYVILDGRERLSEFFRKNGPPLTGAAREAAQQLVGGEYAEIFGKQYDAFDEENEAASLFPEETEERDRRFCALAQEQGQARYARAKAYIMANSAYFVPNW